MKFSNSKLWLSLLAALLLLSNVTVSTTRVEAASTNRDIMQAKNFLWFGLPYVAQLSAHIVYDNGAGFYDFDKRWVWTRKPKMWKPGSYLNCQLDGIVAQRLVGDGCHVKRISRRKVEVSVVWRQEVKVLGIGMERTCSMRAYISTPDAGISNRRWGGGC